MEELRYSKVCCNKSCFISNTVENFNKCSSELIVGNKGKASFRSLLSFNKYKLINIDFCKCELVIYIKDIKIAKNIESFMLNVGINLETFNCNLVDWNNAPKIYEECHAYKIDKNFKNNYIKLDVTSVMKILLKYKYEEIGFTLIGFCDNSLLNIENYNKVGKPFLRFIYKDRCNKNIIRYPQIDSSFEKKMCILNESAYLKTKINGDEILCESKSNDYIDVNEDKGEFIFNVSGDYELISHIENKSWITIQLIIDLCNENGVEQLLNCSFVEGKNIINLKVKITEKKNKIKVNFNRGNNVIKLYSEIKIIKK